MKINNTHAYLNFKSIRYRYSHYEDCYGITRETQNTTCVREDLDCHELAKIIKKNFKNIDKLSLKPMNASDLTETYAVTSALIDAFGFKTVQEKFSPILATDVDSYIINKFGKKGVIGLTPKDETQIGKKNIKKFFEKISQEPFKEKNGETIEEKYKRMEGHYDIIYETRRRHERRNEIEKRSFKYFSIFYIKSIFHSKMIRNILF